MSMVYIVILIYIKLFEEIDVVILVYVEWLKKGYVEGIFFVFGRWVLRNGGVIFVKSESFVLFEEWLCEDLF